MTDLLIKHMSTALCLFSRHDITQQVQMKEMIQKGVVQSMQRVSLFQISIWGEQFHPDQVSRVSTLIQRK